MATFRFGHRVDIWWNRYEIKGDAGTVFSLPDQLYEEFENDFREVEPTLEWIDTNEFATLVSTVPNYSVYATAPIAVTSTSNSKTWSLNANYSTSTHDHAGVYQVAGSYSSATHLHNGTYQPAGTYVTGLVGGNNISVSGTTSVTVGINSGTALNGYIMAANGSGGSIFIAASTGGLNSIVGVSPISATVVGNTASVSLDANYATSTHTHTSFANNLQINKADSKVQLLNTTSGSGTEDGMYLLMADTDVGYLWNAETNGALVFGTGGAERARITPAGKFGIGTSAPSNQLEVVGPASVTVALTAGGSGFAELKLVGPSGKNYITSDDTLSFDIGGAERATVATTGLNVTSGTLSQGGTAVSLSGHTHSVVGTSPISATVATSTGAIALSHATSGVTAATYGSATAIPVIAINATGHITSASTTSITVPEAQPHQFMLMGV